MKKIFILLLLFIVISMTACNNNPAVDSGHDSQQQNTETTPTEENESDDTNGSTDPVDTEISELSLKEISIEINESHQTDVSALYYTEALGIIRIDENSLPAIFGFEYPYVYYYCMSVIIQGASQEEPDVYVGRYSIETKEKHEFAIDSFFATSYEGQVVVNNDCVVFMYTTISELSGHLVMVTELFNFADGTRQILDETPAHNVFGYAKRLNENEFIFLMYESTSDGTRQKITRYNHLTNEFVEIYRGEIMGGYKESQTSSKDIWAIDAYNGEIYLFMQQYSEDRMHSFMQKLDRDGNMLSEERIDSLSQYDKIEDCADSLVVLDDYAVIHYTKQYKSASNTNPISAILYHTEDGYEFLDTSEKIKLNTCHGTVTTDHLTAFFATYNDDNSINYDTMFACNSRTNEGISIHMDCAGVGNYYIDSKGNLLVFARDNDKSHWYVVPASEFLAVLEN